MTYPGQAYSWTAYSDSLKTCMSPADQFGDVWTETIKLTAGQFYIMPYSKSDPLNAFSGSVLSISTPVFSNKSLIGVYGAYFDLNSFFTNLVTPILDPSI